MRINTNAKTLDLLIWMVQKCGFGPKRVFGSVAREAVKSCKALLVPDFVRAIQPDLPEVVLVLVDPVS